MNENDEALVQILESLAYLHERDLMVTTVIKSMHNVLLEQASKISFLEKRVWELEEQLKKD